MWGIRQFGCGGRGGREGAAGNEYGWAGNCRVQEGIPDASPTGALSWAGPVSEASLRRSLNPAYEILSPINLPVEKRASYFRALFSGL